MSKSRLKSHLQKKAVQNILLTLVGMAIIIGVLFSFGPQLLIKFSILTEKLKGTPEVSNDTEDTAFVAPPTLNSLQSATNSAKIIISGYSSPKQKIKLYLNGDVTHQTEVKDDKTFVFDDITLKPGDNEIKAKAVTDGDKQSEFSTAIKITYVNKSPTLDINSPSEGQSIPKDQNPIKIAGKTDPGDKVTVNSFWAIVDDEGKFSYTLQLQDGDNTIKFEATDDAGNKTTKEIKVHLN